MGKIVRQGVEYGGSSNSADCIKYNDSKNVKEVIDDIKDTAMFIDSFDTNTGTLNTTSVSSGSSSNPTAASVTFDNTDTGLNATNVQDAVTEINGKLKSLSTIGKKLWSGSFTEGTITVPGLSKYKIFIMSVGGVVCIGNVSYGIGGCVGYGVFITQTYGYRFTPNTSLETLTIDSINRGGSNGTGNVAVTDIYGLF